MPLIDKFENLVNFTERAKYSIRVSREPNSLDDYCPDMIYVTLHSYFNEEHLKFGRTVVMCFDTEEETECLYNMAKGNYHIEYFDGDKLLVDYKEGIPYVTYNAKDSKEYKMLYFVNFEAALNFIEKKLKRTI